MFPLIKEFHSLSHSRRSQLNVEELMSSFTFLLMSRNIKGNHSTREITNRRWIFKFLVSETESNKNSNNPHAIIDLSLSPRRVFVIGAIFLRRWQEENFLLHHSRDGYLSKTSTYRCFDLFSLRVSVGTIVSCVKSFRLFNLLVKVIWRENLNSTQEVE